jgi:hypothetical protein
MKGSPLAKSFLLVFALIAFDGCRYISNGESLVSAHFGIVSGCIALAGPITAVWEYRSKTPWSWLQTLITILVLAVGTAWIALQIKLRIAPR